MVARRRRPLPAITPRRSDSGTRGARDSRNSHGFGPAQISIRMTENTPGRAHENYTGDPANACWCNPTGSLTVETKIAIASPSVRQHVGNRLARFRLRNRVVL